MSYEAQIAALLAASPEVTAVLLGGIYVYAELTPEGVSRLLMPDAYDADGFLRPLAIVKQRGLVPDGNVVEYDTQDMSAIQIIECWLYQRIYYDALDAVKPHIYATLQGVMLPGAFELALVNTLERQRDNGALQDASMERMDFACYTVAV